MPRQADWNRTKSHWPAYGLFFPSVVLPLCFDSHQMHYNGPRIDIFLLNHQPRAKNWKPTRQEGKATVRYWKEIRLTLILTELTNLSKGDGGKAGWYFGLYFPFDSLFCIALHLFVPLFACFHRGASDSRLEHIEPYLSIAGFYLNSLKPPGDMLKASQW